MTLCTHMAAVRAQRKLAFCRSTQRFCDSWRFLLRTDRTGTRLSGGAVRDLPQAPLCKWCTSPVLLPVRMSHVLPLSGRVNLAASAALACAGASLSYLKPLFADPVPISDSPLLLVADVALQER